ncbi:hypothetical protein J8Z24_11875 [Pseudoalteromonas sp. SCSIO 43201]|uniref:hypothetical protein n=1 Tax=Pseudoalteromonas sp. SCSIO 43201 TaxID=2822842 RepID=UPI002074E2A1|nr:hypothetical protein [Pseudoalteromonas sp. SCSIO 43201]USD27648.1 hypothetical protein J8Z24_11875 [Pseudoalteromonas sp. SCSIO 43201]
MSVWGVNVEDSDSFADVYDSFFDIYNHGAGPEYASSEVKESFSEYFEDYEDSNNSWFALAFAQWETKSLEQSVYEKVRSIISSGSDLKLWEELGASKEGIKNRKIALDLFLEEISSERKTKKRRKKPKHDFRTNKLVELVAPDNQKVFTVTEEFSDGKYIHTSALMMWGSGGGSIFYFSKEGTQVSAEWQDSQKLIVTTEKGIEFAKKDDSAFFCGDKIEIIYL